MDDRQILEVTTYLCEVYNRNSNPGLLEVMAEMYGDWSQEEFMACAHQHIRNPDRGRFFPVPADMEFQRHGDRLGARERAAEEFDINPLCDGTSQFDADRESYERRDQRRRAWISRAVHQFEGQGQGGERPYIDGPRRGMIGGPRGSH